MTRRPDTAASAWAGTPDWADLQVAFVPTPGPANADRARRRADLERIAAQGTEGLIDAHNRITARRLGDL